MLRVLAAGLVAALAVLAVAVVLVGSQGRGGGGVVEAVAGGWAYVGGGRVVVERVVAADCVRVGGLAYGVVGGWRLVVVEVGVEGLVVLGVYARTGDGRLYGVVEPGLLRPAAGGGCVWAGGGGVYVVAVPAGERVVAVVVDVAGGVGGVYRVVFWVSGGLA